MARKNQTIFEQTTIPPMEAVNRALAALCEDYKEAYRNHPNISSSKLRWQPQDTGEWKLNLNGAIFPDHHHAGAGLVLCDELGTVIFSATIPETSLSDPLEVELMAILRGLQLYIPLCILKLTVETDCHVAVQALDEGANSVAANRHLMSAILRSRFGSCTFSYVSRMGNQVTHSLAHFAWQVSDATVWWASCPDFSTSALWIDSNMYHQNVILLNES